MYPSLANMGWSNQHQMAGSAPPVGNLNDYQKGQRALTMLLQLPSFSGGPVTRFDRWIKLFENIVTMSNWTPEEKVNMLVTKMTDKAHDILQNIMECYTNEYEGIKDILHELFHGSETEDFYQKKFEDSERKPQESVLDYAFRLKTIFQRAYPPRAGETSSEGDTRHLFLRQKFLQGLDSSLRSKLRHKPCKKFEDMVRDAQKYSIRMEEDKDEKTKREFISAVSNPSVVATPPEFKEMVEAMKINNDTINAIATSLRFGSKPPEKQVVSPPEMNTNSCKQLSAMIAKAIQENLHSCLPQNQGQFNTFPSAQRQQFPRNQQFNSFPGNRPNYQPPQQANPFSNPNRPNRFNTPRSPIICEFCGYQGHSQNSCMKLMNKKALELGTPPICYSCRNIGHRSYDCPNRTNKPSFPGSNGPQGNA